ncbi:hypothetical protein, partial [Mesorhizobium sp.]|uniref:hypothetical protein n=1 Tax=Mesorhizobium sp. TaxID=1871066 RepID=UPI00258A64ED
MRLDPVLVDQPKGISAEAQLLPAANRFVIEAEAILVRSIVVPAAPASAGRVAGLCKAHMISSREMPMSPRTPSGKRLNWSVADKRAFPSARRRNHLR